MDMVYIEPQRLEGSVKIPPSKSYAHRALICAALSEGECKIENIRPSQDILATLNVIRAFGAEYVYDEKKSHLTVKGRGTGGFGALAAADCNESGSTLRFFMPIAAALGIKSEFTGHGRLMQRPLKPYFDLFKKCGVKCEMTRQDTVTVSGHMRGGTYTVDGSESSQFVSGMLFALACAKEDSRLVIDGALRSRGYVDITLDVMKSFGVKVKNNNYESFEIRGGQRFSRKTYRVEGDFSQAAFFLAAGAIGSDIVCEGLNEDSIQGDKKITDIIREAGGIVKSCGKGRLRARCTSLMHGITVDADEIPDLVPIIAVMLCFCRGESRIINAGRLRLKESDRLRATASELSRLGANIYEGSDYLKIVGGQVLCGNTVSAWNDHRIAMAAAIAASRCEGGVGITGALQAVKKSYPDFFGDYRALGGNVR